MWFGAVESRFENRLMNGFGGVSITLSFASSISSKYEESFVLIGDPCVVKFSVDLSAISNGSMFFSLFFACFANNCEVPDRFLKHINLRAFSLIVSSIKDT